MEFFESYKINEVLQHKYYQIPQELFENSFYKDLCLESKILYAFLLDRLTLSKKNHWINENGEIYLIFTRIEVQEKLNLSDKPVSKAFRQLVEVNLINEKKQGFGKPKLIFVGKIQHQDISSYSENIRVDNRKNSDTIVGQNMINDTENLRAINTNIINTDSINPQSDDGIISLNKIKEQCCLEEFEPKDKSILEDVIDTLYNVDTLKVGAVEMNHLKILSKLELITKENLQQLLDILESTPNIKKVTNYLMRCLFNNLGSSNYTPKKEKANKHYGREYPEGYLDNLYANMQKTDFDNED